MSDEREPVQHDEAPPFGGSWSRLYAIVLANLVLWIGIMVLITKALS